MLLIWKLQTYRSTLSLSWSFSKNTREIWTSKMRSVCEHFQSFLFHTRGYNGNILDYMFFCYTYSCYMYSFQTAACPEKIPWRPNSDGEYGNNKGFVNILINLSSKSLFKRFAVHSELWDCDVVFTFKGIYISYRNLFERKCCKQSRGYIMFLSN